MTRLDRQRLYFILTSALAADASAQPMGDVEIEFEPMGPGGPPQSFDDLFQALQNGGGPGEGAVIEMDGPPPFMGGPFGGRRGPHHGHPGHPHREAQLDDMLAQMFGPPPGMRGRHPHSRGMGPMGPMGNPLEQMLRAADNGKGDIEIMESDNGGEPVVMEIDGGPMGMMMDGPPPGMMLGGPGGPRGRPDAITGAMLRDLFPGPLMIDGPQEHPHPFDRPDPMIMDMLSAVDRGFTEDLLPAAIKAASSERLPNSCDKDINDLCASAGKSHLHCLGQHADSVSEACRNDVGKSVPFRCSRFIDKFCDVLQTGILDCLESHLTDLDGPCKDGVMTTKHVINKANTQKASVVDPATGSKKVNRPAAAAASGTASGNSALPLNAAAPSLQSANTAFLAVDSGSSARSWSTPLLLCVIAVVGWIAFLSMNTDLSIRLRKVFMPHTLDGSQRLLHKGLEMPKPVD